MDASIELAIRQNLKYDGDTGKLYWRKTRGGRIRGSEAGTVARDGYIRVGIARKKLYVHRISWFLYYGKWVKGEIDHIDGNRANNKIENLRDVLHRTNQMNRKTHRDGRLVGAKFEKRGSMIPWVSQIRLNGVKVHLGCFSTESEAHIAYLKAFEAWEGIKP